VILAVAPLAQASVQGHDQSWVAKKWNKAKEKISRGLATLKKAFAKGNKAGCASGDELYATLCPDEGKLAAAYGEYFDQPRGKGLDNTVELSKLQTWFTANKATYVDWANTKLDAMIDGIKGLSDPDKAALKTRHKTFTIENDLAEASFMTGDGMFLAYAEANAANNMGYPEYLKFSFVHEKGHMLDHDPTVMDGANPASAPAKKAFTHRGDFTAKNAGWAREMFADRIATEATKGFTKDEILKAVAPFCGGGNDANYPPMKERLLLMARSPGWYATLCGASPGARGTAGTDYFEAL